MYSFVNDYSEGAHPSILELLTKYNLEKNNAYGLDNHSLKAKKYLIKLINNNGVDIHFIHGGTMTNLLVISSMLKPYQGVIAADTGHINTHETGAIEATGHKIIQVKNREGKISSEDIESVLENHTNEHMVMPKMVYISNSTELGSIYNKNELTKISKTCKENNLILFMDGARLGAALTCDANDLELSDIVNLVDVFYIGGTKNGALLGEALIIVDNKAKENFRYYIKQRGGMLAKGFVLGIQFEALFKDKLFFQLARHSNDMAKKLAKIIKDQGYDFYTEPYTNQLFPIFPNQILEKLDKDFDYIVDKKIDKDHTVIRLVTSWATSLEAIDAFKIALSKYK